MLFRKRDFGAKAFRSAKPFLSACLHPETSRPRKARLCAGVSLRPGTSPRLRRCMVADAVTVERVAEASLSANREKNRDRPAKRRPKAI